MDEGHGCGLARFDVLDPVLGATVPCALWYPTGAPEARVDNGRYAVSVAVDALPLPGRRPLLVITHASGSSLMAHRCTAAFLARRGVAVLGLTHPGDNEDDRSLFGTDAQAFGRGRQVSAALDAALAHPLASPGLDPGWVAGMGLSFGGFTALCLLGGQPDLAELPRYCAQHGEDPAMCGPNGFRGRVRVTDAGRERPATDGRFKAGVLLAPTWGFMFGERGPDAVRAPILICDPTRDEILRRPCNALHIARTLPVWPDYVAVEGAGHYAFLTLPPPGLPQAAAEQRYAPPGFDRGTYLGQGFHPGLLWWLRRTLGVPHDA